MLGISAIGSLMFWATDNDNYTEENRKGRHAQNRRNAGYGW